jgi:hypothetical protein
MVIMDHPAPHQYTRGDTECLRPDPATGPTREQHLHLTDIYKTYPN